LVELQALHQRPLAPLQVHAAQLGRRLHRITDLSGHGPDLSEVVAGDPKHDGIGHGRAEQQAVDPDPASG
jgi:hypothetical protein